MYVGHKNTTLQNVPHKFCRFVSGHIMFDILFHLIPQRAVACHGEEPLAATTHRHYTPPPPPHTAAPATRLLRRRRCCRCTPPLPLPPPPPPAVPSDLRFSSPPRCHTRWYANAANSPQPPPTTMRGVGAAMTKCMGGVNQSRQF